MTTILKFFFWSDSTKGMAKVRLVGISLLVSFSFFLVSIDLVFVMNLSWDGVTLRFLDSLVFVVKKCTHRGCKILVSTMYFLFCSKDPTISKQRAHRPIPMWSFEANDNGFANFFWKCAFDLRPANAVIEIIWIASTMARFVTKKVAVFYMPNILRLKKILYAMRAVVHYESDMR